LRTAPDTLPDSSPYELDASVIAAIKVELCTLQRAAGPRGLRGPRPRLSLPLRSTGHQWDARPKTQVRRKLAAGGKRIRTPGPTLTKVSVGVLPKGDPGTTGWGPVLSSGPLARWRLAARPLRGPYTARPRFRISFAPAESPNFRYRSLGTTPTAMSPCGQGGVPYSRRNAFISGVAREVSM
jgi:hypothetical protein